MVTVTRKNFEALLPEIAEKIEKCTFIAIDAEYTGIYSVDNKSTKSLFDSMSSRYEKARENASKFSISQYGIALFRKDRDSNVYYVDVYNFYVFPVSFDSFCHKEVLSCQVSCLNFLARHNFDFNLFIREGIPYLNREKSEQLRSFLQTNRHILRTSEHLDPFYFPEKTNFLNDDDIEEIINQLAGFSKVVDFINASEKPVVGHNLLMDLMFTYQLFWANLPKSYDQWKKSTKEMFPVIYDTKFLAREVNYLRRKLNEDDCLLSDSNLFALYTNTYSDFKLNTPLVDFVGDAAKYKEILIKGRGQNMESLPSADCHCAGFDAVVTGCVFLNLSFMAARPGKTLETRPGLPPTFTELLGRTENWKDKINVARAVIPFINLAGADPKSHRPNWIVAKSTNHIDPLRLKLELVKFGDVEVDPVNDKEVVIACGGIGCHKHVKRELTKQGFALKDKAIGIGLTDRYKNLIVAVGITGALVISIVVGKSIRF